MTAMQKFEQWYLEWRRSTWRVIPSDPRKEMPEHWNTNSGHHMEIAYLAGRTAALEEAAQFLKDEAGFQRSRSGMTAQMHADLLGTLAEAVGGLAGDGSSEGEKNA